MAVETLPLSQMSRAQARAAIEHITGAPMPVFEGPNWRLAWAEWEVATNLLMAAARYADRSEAIRRGVSLTLMYHALPLTELRPALEKVLGRALTDSEMEAGELAG